MVEAGDDGMDDDRTLGCNRDCTLGPSCGGGIRQEPEMNGAPGSSCSAAFHFALP